MSSPIVQIQRAFVGTVAAALFLVPTQAWSQLSPDQLEAVASGFEWRNVGPTIMGGRVSDLAVVESDPSIFYVGTATGGVWKTLNHGTTFEPVFDHEATASVGDVTLAPSNPNVVWVGTGEPQNRQSSPWGNGVYKSTDAGHTWTHQGLEATHHISRIQIHPLNPDVVYVAAMGRLWGPNPERGVYKTTDGGATWVQVLYVDEHTGVIDLIMDPGDPKTLFAATYQRQRTGWGFNGGGPGSGIHRTTDGGASWIELTEGLPAGDKGRIGLDIYRGDSNVVYAIVEADKRRPGQGFGQGGGGQNGVYRSVDRGLTWEQTSTTNNRPMYYSQVRIDPTDPERLYLGGANLYRSSDGGKTFTDDAADGVHLDHHALWIDPANSDHMILGSDGGVSVTWDRGENWRQVRNLPLAQFYEIGVDMADPYHVCGGLQDNGSWCAPSDTWSNQGIRTRDWYNVGGGDGFYTVMHPTRPDVMFAESQGGNLTRVDLTTMERARIRPVARPTEDDEEREFRFNWNSPVVLSSHDPNTVYFGGNVLFRSRDLGNAWEEISPDLTHEIDRDTLEIMGVAGAEAQLSRNDGQSTYGNIETIAESPLNADVLYTGSDDGLVYGTRDGGTSWTNLTPNVPGLPAFTYVSRVVASAFDEGRVYATFDGHRNDDFAAYVYRSTDFGASWESITDGLPATSVNVIAEHPSTRGLLFLGNEVGAYYSVARGDGWGRLAGNLPTVPVDDIKVHPRDNDLVLGTHGRGIWILDDLSPLEQLSAPVLAAEAHLFDVRRATSYTMYRPQGWTPSVYAAPNAPYGALIRYHVGQEPVAATPVVADGENGSQGENGGNGSARGRSTGSEDGTAARITILDANGDEVRSLEGAAAVGLHQVVWDLRLEPPYERDGNQGGGGGFFGAPRGPRVLPGAYTVRLEVGETTAETSVDVRLDPRLEVSTADLAARQDALMSAYRLAKPIYDGQQAVGRLNRQLRDIEALLRDHEVPETVTDEVASLKEDLESLREDIDDAARGARGAFAIEGSTTAPTADQLWQLEQTWETLPPLLEQLNVVITDRMPALNRQLDDHGVRPDPGEAVDLPRRGGN